MRTQKGIFVKKRSRTVGDYISSSPKNVRGVLEIIRQTIRGSAPKARERMSYGMPFYEFGGSGFKGRLIYFSLSKDHISVYIPPSVAGPLKALGKYRKTKSAFHFSLDEPFPFALLGKTVKIIVKNRNAQNKK